MKKSFLENFASRMNSQKKPDELKNLEDKKYVARLITRVLTENLDVKRALLHFPKDSEDKSICAAWHALMHYESDEERRAEDRLYNEAQIDYLMMIANTLENGEDLPQNIIDEYKDFYGNYLTPHEEGFKGFWHTIFQFMNLK